MANLTKRVRRFISVSVLAIGTFYSLAQSNLSSEYQVKAVFLFNFAQFVEWPANTFSAADAPFIIGVLGKDPFGDYLDETVKGEKINGHPMVIKRFKVVGEATGSHILFISLAKGDHLQDVLDNLKSQKILTVGDVSNFTHQGGMIGFFKESSKIRIQINLEVAKGADLTVSSKLLRVAEVVNSKRN